LADIKKTWLKSQRSLDQLNDFEIVAFRDLSPFVKQAVDVAVAVVFGDVAVVANKVRALLATLQRNTPHDFQK
jgi:hypothetical protein